MNTHTFTAGPPPGVQESGRREPSGAAASAPPALAGVHPCMHMCCVDIFVSLCLSVCLCMYERARFPCIHVIYLWYVLKSTHAPHIYTHTLHLSNPIQDAFRLSALLPSSPSPSSSYPHEEDKAAEEVIEPCMLLGTKSHVNVDLTPCVYNM